VIVLDKRIRKNIETIKALIEISEILEKQGRSITLKDLAWLFPEKPRAFNREQTMRMWTDLRHEKAMRELRQRLEDKARAIQERSRFFSRVHRRVVLKCPKGHTVKIIKSRFEEMPPDERITCPLCELEHGAFEPSSKYEFPKKDYRVVGEEIFNPYGR